VLFPPPQRVRLPSRVVITGAGCITALGRGWVANAAGFRAGRVAIKRVTLFDVERQRAKSAGQAEVPEEVPPGQLSRARVRRLDRTAKMLFVAADEAWRQAGWRAPAGRLPVVLGTTSGGMSLGETFYRQVITPPHSRRHQAARVLGYQAQCQANALCEALGVNGPLFLIANACASGANAIGHAWEMVRQSQAERVLAGGYDGLCHLVFAGFDSLQALSTGVCRPFDAQRDGLAVGEGAAVLALESLDSARSRGGEILGEIVGYGATTDVHHLTQPHPEGNAAFGAMTAACASAGLQPEQIGYINAHGTGTFLNDAAEAAAINRWAGRHATHVPVSSTKSSIGHLLGAAGAVEALVCVMALREQWLPPTSTLQTLDPVCRFPLVTQQTRASFDYALSNSFGFGGANASLVLRRWS
jgi:3-oxoacyl-[acyl-carrier-protein] synthase II